MKEESLDYILGIYPYTRRELETFAVGSCSKGAKACDTCKIKKICIQENDKGGCDPFKEWAKKELKKHFGLKK